MGSTCPAIGLINPQDGGVDTRTLTMTRSWIPAPGLLLPMLARKPLPLSVLYCASLCSLKLGRHGLGCMTCDEGDLYILGTTRRQQGCASWRQTGEYTHLPYRVFGHLFASCLPARCGPPEPHRYAKDSALPPLRWQTETLWPLLFKVLHRSRLRSCTRWLRSAGDVRVILLTRDT